MLRGPTWSGSIQQDLIEKLWVAILAYDTSETKASKETVNAKTSEETSESEDSEESSSDSEDDSDIDLSDYGGSLALMDRIDLFSIAKVKQSQQSSSERALSKESDEADCVSSQGTKDSISLSDGGDKCCGKERNGDINRSQSCDTPSDPFKDSSPSNSGAKPKLILTSTSETAVQSRRPRPNTLTFNNAQKKSKIPQLSPVSPIETSIVKTCRAITKNYSFNSASSANRQDERKNTSRKPSKIPISPTRQSASFDIQDRSKLLDIVPRRRLASDSRLHLEHKLRKSNPVIWRRRAQTPEAARPYPLQRPSNETARNIKKDTRQFKQTQYYRGNSCRWSPQKNNPDSARRQNFTNVQTKCKKSPKEHKTPSERKSFQQCSNTNRETRKFQSSPSQSRSNSKKNDVQPPTGKSGNVTQPLGSSKKSPYNNDNVQKSNIQGPRSRVKNTTTTPQKHNSNDEETNKENINDTLKDTAIKNTSHKINCNIEEDQEERSGTMQDCEDKITTQELQSEEFCQMSGYGNDIEVCRLEDCLKEAILGVLEGLPEGWILVPEHTAELFSSLTSVVESFPRPEHAHARVLEAIVAAHARRPCGKGEIAALNNAHLLLYVGLKLCCVRGRPVELTPSPKETAVENQTNLQGKKTVKIQDEDSSGNNNDNEKGNDKTCSDCSIKRLEGSRAKRVLKPSNGDSGGHGFVSTKSKNTLTQYKIKKSSAQCEIALKILTEIQKCEGSFDRLMMCLLLGSRAPGRGSGWYCETEEESEKVRDLRFVLNHLKCIEGCRVSEVVSAPLWSCGSSPVVLAALAESPRLVLALLQYGAGGSAANHYLYSKCYTNGVYLAIAYLVRKLESQFKEYPERANPQHHEGEHIPPAAGAGDPDPAPLVAGNEEGVQVMNHLDKRDLLTLAGHTPTALCLRYLLRAVPKVPIKFLRDQLGGYSRECGRDVAYLLPHSCCLQPPTLIHLSRAASRQFLRIHDLLPQVIEDLDVPQTLKDYLNLLRD